MPDSDSSIDDISDSEDGGSDKGGGALDARSLSLLLQPPPPPPPPARQVVINLDDNDEPPPRNPPNPTQLNPTQQEDEMDRLTGVLQRTCDERRAVRSRLERAGVESIGDHPDMLQANKKVEDARTAKRKMVDSLRVAAPPRRRRPPQPSSPAAYVPPLVSWDVASRARRDAFLRTSGPMARARAMGVGGGGVGARRADVRNFPSKTAINDHSNYDAMKKELDELHKIKLGKEKAVKAANVVLCYNKYDETAKRAAKKAREESSIAVKAWKAARDKLEVPKPSPNASSGFRAGDDESDKDGDRGGGGDDSDGGDAFQIVRFSPSSPPTSPRWSPPPGFLDTTPRASPAPFDTTPRASPAPFDTSPRTPEPLPGRDLRFSSPLLPPPPRLQPPQNDDKGKAPKKRPTSKDFDYDDDEPISRPAKRAAARGAGASSSSSSRAEAFTTTASVCDPLVVVRNEKLKEENAQLRARVEELENQQNMSLFDRGDIGETMIKLVKGVCKEIRPAFHCPILGGPVVDPVMVRELPTSSPPPLPQYSVPSDPLTIILGLIS